MARPRRWRPCRVHRGRCRCQRATSWGGGGPRGRQCAAGACGGGGKGGATAVRGKTTRRHASLVAVAGPVYIARGVWFGRRGAPWPVQRWASVRQEVTTPPTGRPCLHADWWGRRRRTGSAARARSRGTKVAWLEEASVIVYNRCVLAKVGCRSFCEQRCRLLCAASRGLPPRQTAVGSRGSGIRWAGVPRRHPNDKPQQMDFACRG